MQHFLKRGQKYPQTPQSSVRKYFTYWRSGPVEPDSARDDPLVRSEGRQQEVSFCLGFAHSQCNTLEKVVDAESQDYKESS